MTDPQPDPQQPDRQEPEPQSALDRRAAATAKNRRQAWLYIVIGVVLGIIAVLGLVAEDRSILDWLLLVLAVLNLGIGVMALLRPEPRLGDPADG